MQGGSNERENSGRLAGWQAGKQAGWLASR